MEDSKDTKHSEKVRLINYIFPIVLLALLAGGYFFFTNQSTTGQAVAKDLPPDGSVYYFFRAGCHFCELEEPIIENLASEGYNVAWMDVGIHQDYIKKYGISGTPTFLASNGDRHEGFLEFDALKAWLDQHGAKAI